MKIEISLDNLLKYGNAVRGDWEKELNPSDDEREFLSRVLSFLPDTVQVERRSNDYISVICENNDFLRFKLSPRTKWLSLNLPSKLRPKYIESPLFAAQKKKTVVHWKAALNDISSVEVYKDLIIASCRPVPEC